jgi:hypothetical protein
VVVHCNPKFLLTSEISLGRLDRDVLKQELNLVEFATGEVAETRTCSAEVMRCQLLDTGARGRGTYDVPTAPWETSQLPTSGQPC